MAESSTNGKVKMAESSTNGKVILLHKQIT